MTDQQRGYSDNLAGVPRNCAHSSEWLSGWDEAQGQRLQDEREVRVSFAQLQGSEWHWECSKARPKNH